MVGRLQGKKIGLFLISANFLKSFCPGKSQMLLSHFMVQIWNELDQEAACTNFDADVLGRYSNTALVFNFVQTLRSMLLNRLGQSGSKPL